MTVGSFSSSCLSSSVSFAPFFSRLLLVTVLLVVSCHVYPVAADESNCGDSCSNHFNDSKSCYYSCNDCVFYLNSSECASDDKPSWGCYENSNSNVIVGQTLSYCADLYKCSLPAFVFLFLDMLFGLGFALYSVCLLLLAYKRRQLDGIMKHAFGYGVVTTLIFIALDPYFYVTLQCTAVLVLNVICCVSFLVVVAIMICKATGRMKYFCSGDDLTAPTNQLNARDDTQTAPSESSAIDMAQMNNDPTVTTAADDAYSQSRANRESLQMDDAPMWKQKLAMWCMPSESSVDNIENGGNHRSTPHSHLHTETGVASVRAGPRSR